MQRIFPISDPELEALAVNAVGGVFKTMLGSVAALTRSLEIDQNAYEKGVRLPIDTDRTLIAGTVGFVGRITGVIYFFMDLPLAHAATCKLLGLAPDELDSEGHETVNDAIGELTNMIVGTFKNDFGNKGFECRMTTPSILRGSNYTIQPAEAALRRIYRFDSDGHAFVIDVLMKEEIA